MKSGSLSNETVYDEEYDRSQCGDNYATEIEGFDSAQANEAAQKTADDGADNADNDCDKHTSGVFARYNEFGKCARDQAEKNPGNYTHILEATSK